MLNFPSDVGTCLREKPDDALRGGPEAAPSIDGKTRNAPALVRLRPRIRTSFPLREPG